MAGGFNGLRGISAGLGIVLGDRHMGTFSTERLDDGPSDAPPSASDQSKLSV